MECKKKSEIARKAVRDKLSDTVHGIRNPFISNVSPFHFLGKFLNTQLPQYIFNYNIYYTNNFNFLYSMKEIITSSPQVTFIK